MSRIVQTIVIAERVGVAVCHAFPLSRRARPERSEGERGPGVMTGPAADRKGYIVGTMGRYASMLLASAVVGLAPLVAGCTERTPRVPEYSVCTLPGPPAAECTSGLPVVPVGPRGAPRPARP